MQQTPHKERALLQDGFAEEARILAPEKDENLLSAQCGAHHSFIYTNSCPRLQSGSALGPIVYSSCSNLDLNH